jgi:hemerythrin-like domain-containing protein
MKSFLSQLLLSEHSVILQAEDLISANNELWLSNPAEYEDAINQLLVFFTEFADEFHHAKEEEILFPEISKRNELSGQGIISELLEQHETFRECAQDIRSALKVKDYNTVQTVFEKYISDLKDHIAIENDELFPMAESLFTTDELETLYFRSLDKDNMLGMGRKEELINFVQNFKFNETVR